MYYFYLCNFAPHFFVILQRNCYVILQSVKTIENSNYPIKLIKIIQ